MAGTTSAGATLNVGKDLSNTMTNTGGKDVFVAQYSTSDGQLQFTRQIGSAEDDWLSYGRTIVTDNQGNAILTGNTRGSLFREKLLNVSDLFVMSIQRETGAFESPQRTPQQAMTSSDSSKSNRRFFLFPGFISVTMITVIVAFVCYLLTARRLRRRRTCFRRRSYSHELRDGTFDAQDELDFYWKQPRRAKQVRGPTIVHLNPSSSTSKDKMSSCYLNEEEEPYDDVHELLRIASQRVTLDTYDWDNMVDFLDETSLT